MSSKPLKFSAEFFFIIVLLVKFFPNLILIGVTGAATLSNTKERQNSHPYLIYVLSVRSPPRLLAILLQILSPIP